MGSFSKKSKKYLRRFFAILVVLLLSLQLFASCGRSERGDAELSMGLSVLAEQNSMAMSTVKGGAISFDAEDFARATNLSKIDSITITKLPPVSDGELRVGSSLLNAPQTLSASSIKLLSYEPRGAVNVSEFFFKINEEPTELCCKLYVLDSPNSAPTLSVAPKSSLEVSTFENVLLHGNLFCYDPDGDKTYIEIVSQPKKGILLLEDRESGAYKFIPNEDFTGKDSFVYVARDIYGNYSASKEVSLSVKENSTSVSYVDLVDSRYHNSAIAMTEEGIMSGTKIGNASYFYPDREVSREEFTVMAMNAMGIKSLNQTGNATVFCDDSELSANARPYIETAYELGYIKGVEVDGKLYFQPDRAITRAEAASLLCNMLDAPLPTMAVGFADAEDIPAWARDSVLAVGSLGVIEKIDGKISPLACVTRGDASEIFENLIWLRRNS